MEPIEVTARFDPEGKINPVSFTWAGRTYPVTGTGRRWEDSGRLHILALALDSGGGERVYELVFVPSEPRWYLGKFGQDRKTA